MKGYRLTLTGATGFIGRRLLAHICAIDSERADTASAQLASVCVHARRPLATATSSGPGPQAIPPITQLGGDLTQVQTWQHLLRDSDVVVHAAGAVRGRHAADFAINHAAVSALLQAIDTLPQPPKVLLVSSLAARRPALSDYACSKRQGELNLLARPDVPACILRPPAIYGPGDVEMRPLLRLIARGVGVYPGDLDARLSLLHVDDLCRLILAWLQAPMLGTTIEPDDGTPGGYRWRDLHREVATVLGRQVRPLRLSPALLHAVASVLSLATRLPGSHAAPMLSHGKVRELSAPDWVCAPLHDRIGRWSPLVSLHAGLSRLLLHPADPGILV